MSNLLCWVKGLGVVIFGAIAFSGNSAIAKINQDTTLPNNDLNTSNFSTVLEKHNISGDNALKFNYSIDQIQIQDRNAIEKQKVQNFAEVFHFKLAETCWIDDDGNMVCKP
ncbi:hypothetical protein [Nostoc sp. CALU 1950]|uniref:hypothetical protein n=1 Tax=Nostoc sp. CALU 1950 TaxID=3104321 RepID=UPI003EB70835